MKPIFFLVFLLPFLACSPIEEVETKNEEGQFTERYSRRKKDFVKEGTYQKMRLDGSLKESCEYKNDTIQGDYTYYYQNGKVESVQPFEKGVLHGTFKKYDERGNLLLEQPYLNGVLQGVSTAYYPSGKLKEKVTFSDSEENGAFSEFYESGQKKAEGFYKDGDNEQGELLLYDSLGQLERKMQCEAGACVTSWQKESGK